MKRFLITLVLLNLAMNEEIEIEQELLGGYKTQKPEFCQEMFNKMRHDYSTFQEHEILSCETQLVNGVNYRMILKNTNHQIQQCTVTIYSSFKKDKIYYYKQFHGEDDCFTKMKSKLTKTVKGEVL
jgi:hypothetical protein